MARARAPTPRRLRLARGDEERVLAQAVNRVLTVERHGQLEILTVASGIWGVGPQVVRRRKLRPYPVEHEGVVLGLGVVLRCSTAPFVARRADEPQERASRLMLPVPLRCNLVWWSRIVLVLRVSAALFALIVGVLSVLEHYELVTLSPNFDPWVWSVSLAIIAADNVGSLTSRGIRARLGSRNAEIEKALMGLLINLAKARPLRFEEMGASVYVPWWRDRVLRKPESEVRLKRVVRFRPAGFPQQSGVSWTPAKGAVGECWRLKKTVHKNQHASAREYAGAEITAEQFTAIPEASRAGFDLDEFRSIAGKYAEVLAEPIWDPRKERRIVGVLAIDRPYKGEDASFKVEFSRRATREVAAAAASLISGNLVSKADGA